MPTEHSLSARAGPEGRVPLTGHIPAKWALTCSLVSSLASALTSLITKAQMNKLKH